MDVSRIRNCIDISLAGIDTSRSGNLVLDLGSTDAFNYVKVLYGFAMCDSADSTRRLVCQFSAPASLLD